MSDEMQFGVACGVCGSSILMATCFQFTGLAHPQVICSVCPTCKLVAWVTDECPDCAAGDRTPADAKYLEHMPVVIALQAENAKLRADWFVILDAVLARLADSSTSPEQNNG